MSADRSNNPWLFDLRLRERNVRSGALDEKELSKHLGALKDLEGEIETFGLAQPAIGDGVDEEPELEAGADEDDEDEDDVDSAAPEAGEAVAAAAPEGE